MLYEYNSCLRIDVSPYVSVTKHSTVTLNQTVTNALMSSVYVIHMCVYSSTPYSAACYS